MYGFHTFEKKLKDLQPPEKSGLQYKCLVVTLSIVYEGMNSSETSLKQFSLEIKMYYPLFEITLFYCTANSQFFWMKKCHMSHSTFCNQWNLSHVLIENVIFDI